MKPALRLLFFASFLAACATSTAFDDSVSGYDDDDDSGTVNIGDGDGGGGDGGTGKVDASVDSGASPGDSGDAEGDGDGGPAHPCDGVVCNSPPANVCADGAKLRVYEAVGICEEGECVYESVIQPCGAGGCASGACIDDPCAGVSCNTPPKATCKNENYLTVPQGPGACSEGACSYGSVEKYCAGKCVDDICNGDPCESVTCKTPPASFCSGPNTLTTYASTGLCSGGDCSYQPQAPTHCPYGCASGKCKNDPCAGKVCNTPPARRCTDAYTVATFASTGTCSNGDCSYQSTELSCLHGCVDGYCRECSVNADCGSGKWCSGSTCVSCNDDVHCGASCENCGVAGKVCSAGACVQCTKDSQCPAGKACSNNVCVACDTAQKCGPSCVTCSGTTPTCSGGACVCSGNSCGANQQCVGGACSVCKTDAACGASCSPCGGATPFCLDKGATSECVACRSDNHCGQDETCDRVTGTCRPQCPVVAQSAFSDAFASPSSKSWTTGVDAAVNTSRWRAYTNAKHGLRVYNGRLEITNKASGSPTHGQGYAYVKTGGTGSAYDNSLYSPVLKQNTGREVVWSFNMRRSNDSEYSTNGGFKCSSSSSQNGVTLGVAYILATDSAAGLHANASTCSASATSSGYAVILGGDPTRKIRLVRFTQGLRNGTITDLIAATALSYVDNYASVRVTYNAKNDQWKLEVRDDGTSKFTDPNSGTFKFTGTATDATYVNNALEYAGPYFQTGCSGLCSDTFEAYFDNVNVGVRCAP